MRLLLALLLAISLLSSAAVLPTKPVEALAGSPIDHLNASAVNLEKRIEYIDWRDITFQMACIPCMLGSMRNWQVPEFTLGDRNGVTNPYRTTLFALYDTLG
ncbi:hypothetical protein BDV96DRAFT_594114 [Lophiotrema nucula]|uniref:Uncharacterized protein n=1 Tax=Lophiotrema nucula TaxID=690887 RepID=A0A6A5ZTP0_9PLEO|nr:hypothetical protein BDV96DRAFT_594114 [Lophiotrema nucula]